MRKNQFRAFAGIAALSLCLGLGAAVPANVKAADIIWTPETISSVSLTPGKNETELNFAWYSQGQEDAKVRFGTNSNLSDDDLVIGGDEGKGEDIAGTKSDTINSTYYSNKVTVTGLKEDTTYYYQIKKNGKWTDSVMYQTKSFSDFSFLYVGDPQIGASENAQKDATNWDSVLKQAVGQHDVSFMISAGDQINNTNSDSEGEYSGYLGAEKLKSLPVATTIGNHDSKNPNYSYHFNNPNNFNDAKANSKYTLGRTDAGTDYYYTYGDVLFIVLDTNNYNCATHENVINRAVKENPEAKWRVVTFHQDIYGSGDDHSASDGIVLRTQLTPIMDEYDIDVVLQGHDHTYSRTYQLTGDGKEHDTFTSGDGNISGNFHDYYLSENECYDIKSNVVGGTVENPEGTVYFEANSASGSKYYELIPQQQDYIAERNQTNTPTYSVIDVTEDTFSVTTYDYTTGKQLAGSSTYTIKKTEQSEESQKPVDEDKNTNTNTNTNVNTNTQTPAVTTTAPKKVKGVKVTNKAGKKVKVKWSKAKDADGYQIQYTYKKGFTKKVKTVNVNKANKNSKVLKKMNVGKKVYVKVRAYQNVNGQKVFGNFSKVKKLMVN